MKLDAVAGNSRTLVAEGNHASSGAASSGAAKAPSDNAGARRNILSRAKPEDTAGESNRLEALADSSNLGRPNGHEQGPRHYEVN